MKRQMRFCGRWLNTESLKRWLDTEKASIAFESEQGQDTSCALTIQKGEPMNSEKVYNMEFAKLYPLLVQKAERKGRTAEEVDTIISWLTGYKTEDIRKAAAGSISYGDFFRNAPQLNPDRKLIKGVVCGVRVEEIEEPLMREIRYLDKFIDELAKGKAMEKILRKKA